MKIHTKRAAILVSLILLLAALPALAQDVLTPHRVARIRTVTSVAVSPDAKHVAYLLSVPRQPLAEDDGAAWTELYVAGPDGVSRPFVAGKVNVSQIAWTPDGKAVSFLAKRGGDKAASLYTIAVAGGEAKKIHEHDTAITAYSWSPDGKRFAFLAADAVPVGRRGQREKGFNQEIYEEDVPSVRVWIAAADASAKSRKLDLPGSASELSWSPVGPQLAVALAPTPLVDDEYMQRRVRIVDAESGLVVAKIDNPGKLGEVAWSPDGKTLAMISAADINDPMQGRLMVVPATGGAPRDLLPGYEGHVSAIAWRDNDNVMFIGGEGVWTTFGRVNRDGSDRKTIVQGGGPIFTALSLAADGQNAAFIAQTPAHPGEVYRMKHGDAGPQRVTTSNSWLSGMRMAKQEVVKYKARDGLEIEGILIFPLDADAQLVKVVTRDGQKYEGRVAFGNDGKPTKRYPLILTVHGGPEVHYSNGWLTSYSNPGQVAAARGFAVFYQNYRGSTGRGVKFSKLSQGDPAGKEFDDLVDGVDHLVAAGLVDKARVGVTGGSYGGYATAWCSTFYSDRFAAGVMFVGISDKVSKVGTTDIANEEFYVHALHRPWEAWDMFRERSPIYHAGKSKTPLLILGGTDDPRVHPSQSMEMYRHMKLRSQAPVRLVRYPGERHGNARAASRLDYHLRMLQWLEHYLKGPGGAPPAMDLDYSEPK